MKTIFRGLSRIIRGIRARKVSKATCTKAAVHKIHVILVHQYVLQGSICQKYRRHYDDCFCTTNPEGPIRVPLWN